jgi:predicted NAD/FAD-binding protein
MIRSTHIYYHPLITVESASMVHRLNEINGVSRISFAGAWMGFGFHEDGFSAGVHAARMLIDGYEETEPLDLLAWSAIRKVDPMPILKQVVRGLVLVTQHFIQHETIEV